MMACSKARVAGLLLSSALAGAVPAVAAPLVLDDFASPGVPAFGIPIGSGAQFFERSFGSFAGLAGQVREANYNLYDDVFSGGASASIGGGFAAVAASANAKGEYVFSYGAFTRPTGNPGIAGRFMGLDLRAFDNFRADFSDVKFGLNINVVLYTSAPHLMPDGTPLYYLQSGINIAPASEGSAMVADLYLDERNPIASAFSPYFNFSQVDGVFLVIDRSGFSLGNKYLLDTLSFTQAVPEPSTYVLMLVGLGAVGATARRRHRTAAPPHGRCLRNDDQARGAVMKLLKTLLSVAALAAAMPASAAVFVLDFEGVGDDNAVGDYYNGGAGPNHGVSFSPSALALVDSDAGGIGNFANEPSGDTIMTFSRTGDAVLDVAAGFTTGFSFFYSSDATGSVTVYDGLNATGNVLGSRSLARQADANGCVGDPTGQFCNWTSVGLAFDGTAMSIHIGGAVSRIGFDDITFGSPIAGVPEPETHALMLAGLGIVTCAARRRRNESRK